MSNASTSPVPSSVPGSGSTRRTSRVRIEKEFVLKPVNVYMHVEFAAPYLKNHRKAEVMCTSEAMQRHSPVVLMTAKGNVGLSLRIKAPSLADAHAFVATLVGRVAPWPVLEIAKDRTKRSEGDA